MLCILKDLFRSGTVLLSFGFLLLIAYIGGVNNSNLNYHDINNLKMESTIK